MKSEVEKKSSWSQEWSARVVTAMENVFNKQGKFVALHSISVMIAMFLICALALLGLLNVNMESKPEKLWIPKESDFVKTLVWQKENYPEDIRLQFVIFKADNVLTPSYIKEMFYLRQKIQAIVVKDSLGQNQTQDDMCVRVPALGREWKSRLEVVQSSFSNEEDFLEKFPQEVYCQFYEMIPKACLYLSILEIWHNSERTIESLTQEDIIQGVNTVEDTATYGYPFNFTVLLGGISRNESGHIVGAQSSLHIWTMNNVNRNEIKESEEEEKGEKEKGLSAGMGSSSEVNESLYMWEGQFIETVLETRKSGLLKGLSILPQAMRSFEEVSEQTIFGDVKFLAVGYCLLMAYVTLVLGKFNMVEARGFLCFLGFMSIQLSVFFSFGLCAGLGIIYSPIHSILPILLTGLGVDDMFVIVYSLENMKRTNKNVSTSPPIEERMGSVLASAGTSITVTSLTDVVAFGIGATTTLPALRSFCIYAAVGILCVYVMQITFFFAALTWDQTRLEAGRNGFFWCIKHPNWQPSECSQTNYTQAFIEKVYSKWLLKSSGKALVLLLTASLTACCAWGVSSLRQDFNIIWFLPRQSYVFQFLTQLETLYPEIGNLGTVYIDNINLPQDLSKLDLLTRSLGENEWVSSVDSWYRPLVDYTQSATGVNLTSEVSSEFFREVLGKFLFSDKGFQFQQYIQFQEGELSCMGVPSPIKACKFMYRHRIIEDRNDQIEAMEQIKALVKNANFSGYSACTSIAYSGWETNKVIVRELLQNLGLALGAVFVMAIVLIVNIRAAFVVLFCVLLTLLDVMALMHWWGLTIDTVTCINLVLCVGLSVDYSVHVALHFMKVNGTKNERVKQTLLEIGPPVFHGAFSTFLAIVLLASSDSHVFESFFKILFGVFIFGVYHGLVFLPVLLSLIGPPSYKKKKLEEHSDYIQSMVVIKEAESSIYNFST